jgi:N-methylhydantoinase B
MSSAPDRPRAAADASWALGCAAGRSRIEITAHPDRGPRLAAVVPRDGEPVAALLAALDAALDRWGIAAARVASVSIALPLVDELLARAAAEPVAVVTPRGFGDLLALGRQNRVDLYAARPLSAAPLALCPDALRFEVAGRIDARGREVEPVDEAEVDAVAQGIAASGVGAVAVCGLFAHLDPVHERQIGRRLAQRLPRLAIALSHEVEAQPREFERFLATALDARARPAVQQAARRIADGLAGRGLPAGRLMRGDGTLAGLDEWMRQPLAGAGSTAAALLLAARAARPAGAADPADAIVLELDAGEVVAGLLRAGEPMPAEGPVCAGHRLRGQAFDLITMPAEPSGRLAEALKDLAAAHGVDLGAAALLACGSGADALAAQLGRRLGVAAIRVAPESAAFVASGPVAAATGIARFEMPWREPAAPAADAAAGLDPADGLEHALQGIADRMQALLMASARSTIAREAGDCAAALFLPDGRLLAQARSLPLLLGSLIPAVGAVLERFPAAAMQSGDGFLLNDPWAGGSHLPDLTLVVPLVAEGNLVALAATSLHHQDVGGIAPGSVPPNATSIFDEGLRVPPVHSHRDGRLDPTLRALLLANTRTPGHLEADLDAQWRAAAAAGCELAPLVRRLGGRFAPACEALLAQAEALTRAALAAAPDGRWIWHDQLDGDGVDDRPVPLQVTLVKQGDRLTIDFTGSSPQTRGPANASPAAMMSAALYFMRTLAPEAPNNAGCLAPLTFVLPEESVVNPRWPAAVNARTATVKLACNALLGAWGREAATVTAAAHAGVAVVMSLGGETADGRPFHITEIVASGAGASAAGPGASGLSTDVGNARNTPVEVIETIAPVRVEVFERRRGSGGAGRHRGGDGVRRAYRLLEGRAQLSYRGERHVSRAAGCAGGETGSSTRARVVRADGRVEPLASRARVELVAGDRWIVETAGGGGWGEPADPAGDAVAPSDQPQD